MTYELFIARRLMRAMRRQRQISFTAAIAIAGVTIGVAALVIVLSVFNGFSALLWDSLLSVSPHIVVQKPHAQPMSPNGEQIEQLEKLASIRAAAPFVSTEGFALRRPPGGEMIQAGVAVRGIDAEQLAKNYRPECVLMGRRTRPERSTVRPRSGRARSPDAPKYMARPLAAYSQTGSAQ